MSATPLPRIECGDNVLVYGIGCCIRGIVESMPQGTGDCWVIRETVGEVVCYPERLHYFQQFERIVKERP